MLDMTGTPRSDEDLEDAINAIKVVMVKHFLKIPILTVHCGIIKNGLEELLQRRKADKGRLG